jgi:hypothetical protein
LPEDFEIVDRREVDPIITVWRPSKDKHTQRSDRDDDRD